MVCLSSSPQVDWSRLIDSGGDWDRRNRLKAYNGIYLLSIRSFSPAADLLLDVLSTFTSTELMEFEDVVMYAVLAGTISLSRVDLKTKVLPKPLSTWMETDVC